MGIIGTHFIIALDFTPICANTQQNNPKSFEAKNKLLKGNQLKTDKDCRLGVYTASNQHNEHYFEFCWGIKNHALVDCITGLPIFELTATAETAGSSVDLDVLSQTNFLSIKECAYIADMIYGAKAITIPLRINNFGECVILQNRRYFKGIKSLLSIHQICNVGLAKHKDSKFSDCGRTRQKYCCPLKFSK